MSHRPQPCQNNKESSDVWKKSSLTAAVWEYFFIISTGTNSAQPQVTFFFYDPSAVPWVNVHIISVAREMHQAEALIFTVGPSQSRGCHFYCIIKTCCGYSTSPWQRHTRNRLPEKTFADDVARVLGGLTKALSPLVCFFGKPELPLSCAVTPTGTDTAEKGMIALWVDKV